ncbi:immunity 52 family protein [Photorhabdus namnaonensis]|uniref:Uncharacterized protein n=1 Tax=Photorhabdus namnaonensis TaxID=1851568 RepID=A0A1B8YKR5_9GAMM|nr:immunity 52 family protein [Photorhabdus namnaonensis]OCA55745.1 hypothetical protein Phpb_01129 [Photorhabdus namnaonensis]
MTILSLDIEIYTDWKKPLTPDIAVNDTYKIVKQLEDIFFGYSKVWYLGGDSREEALTRVAFDDRGITDECISDFKENYTEEDPTVISGVWDGGEDGQACSISYFNYHVERQGQTKIEINISIKEKEFHFLKLIDFTKFLVFSHNSPYIMVEANNYRIKRKQVFPDRLSAGWMLYLPIEIDPILVPMAEEIISISDKNDKKGSLIITTKDIFDIENQEHINKANDIEICLQDLQILPLITEV